MDVFGGSDRKQRCRNRPAHNCTPMMPKMKKTKKQSNNTLPSIWSLVVWEKLKLESIIDERNKILIITGKVSNNNMTNIRMPVEKWEYEININ